MITRLGNDSPGLGNPEPLSSVNSLSEVTFVTQKDGREGTKDRMTFRGGSDQGSAGEAAQRQRWGLTPAIPELRELAAAEATLDHVSICFKKSKGRKPGRWLRALQARPELEPSAQR